MEELKNYQEKILEFFNNNFNLIIIFVLILAFIIRFKYLNINSAIWWDEGEYLSIAKNFVFNIPFDMDPARQLLLPLCLAFFYKLGISNLAILKFFTILLPSTGIVYLTYLLGKELYNKYIAIIASFIMTFFWLIVFWSARISTDIFGLFFGLSSFYFFWKGYVKKEKPTLYLSLTGLSLGLGLLTRVGNILPMGIILVYLLVTDRLKIFKNKNLWLGGILSILIFSPYLLWDYLKFGNPFAFTGMYVQESVHSAISFNLTFLTFFKTYLLNFYFIFFLLGLFLFYKLIIGFDLLLKKQENLLSDFFVSLMIIIPLIYFVFIQQRDVVEPRWAIIIAPAVFFITAKGFILIYDFIKKYNNFISILLIVIFILIGGFYQYKYASDLISAKKDTYVQFKEAGLWIKEHSNKDDVIFNAGIPQNTYYSERKTFSLAVGNQSKFEEIVKQYKPKYMVISLLEGESEWISQEEFGPEGLKRWALPYFDSELIIENGQPRATFQGKSTNTFPPIEVKKDIATFRLVHQNPGLFVYEIIY